MARWMASARLSWTCWGRWTSSIRFKRCWSSSFCGVVRSGCCRAAVTRSTSVVGSGIWAMMAASSAGGSGWPRPTRSTGAWFAGRVGGASSAASRDDATAWARPARSRDGPAGATTGAVSHPAARARQAIPSHRFVRSDHPRLDIPTPCLVRETVVAGGVAVRLTCQSRTKQRTTPGPPSPHFRGARPHVNEAGRGGRAQAPWVERSAARFDANRRRGLSS